MAKLQYSGDSIIVPKKSFGLKDLSALTAETGSEFAMFTTGGRRKIIRGDSRSVPIGIKETQELFSEGWRWTAHTHPGYTNTVLVPSENDRVNLKQFLNQTYSVTVNSVGAHKRFSNDWSDWLPSY